MKKPISDLRLEISDVRLGDLDAIAQHYAFETASGVATFDTARPPESYWHTKLRESQENLYPFLVARSQPSEAGPIVCGWAALSRYDPKVAYARTAELSVYVLEAYQRRGIGRVLMKNMLDMVKQHPTIHTLISRVVPTQRASIALHESLGFIHVGTLKSVGFKLGALRDVAIYQFDTEF